MVDYTELRKELYEKFHDAYHKLYVSELQEKIAEMDEVVTGCNHVIAEQQAETESLKIIIKDLERRLEYAEWLVHKYREEEDTK